jgi:hypothetical protein
MQNVGYCILSNLKKKEPLPDIHRSGYNQDAWIYNSLIVGIAGMPEKE